MRSHGPWCHVAPPSHQRARSASCVPYPASATDTSPSLSPSLRRQTNGRPGYMAGMATRSRRTISLDHGGSFQSNVGDSFVKVHAASDPLQHDTSRCNDGSHTQGANNPACRQSGVTACTGCMPHVQSAFRSHTTLKLRIDVNAHIARGS